MTYYIWYKEHKIFDISLRLKTIDCFGYTEIHVALCPEGIAHYVFDNIKTEEKLKEFVFVTGEIDDMRLTLYEGFPDMPDNWNNELLSEKEAERRMLDMHKPKFVEMMQEYCKRYNLFLSED